ncbi:hypothetical protein VPH35_032156 [Triticum aestivum]|uniref:Uncharacterized protein n=1 Tax=Triticum turgidum subsp. durum TaxID=4567 RepID=A0A9R1RT81_TRITD|nr:unnamed protein product [Triticum turgidum subsp. durum]
MQPVNKKPTNQNEKEKPSCFCSSISVRGVDERLAVQLVVVIVAAYGAAAGVRAAQPGDVGGERAADDDADLRQVARERQPEVERPQQRRRDLEHLHETLGRHERQQVDRHRRQQELARVPDGSSLAGCGARRKCVDSEWCYVAAVVARFCFCRWWGGAGREVAAFPGCEREDHFILFF